MESEIFKNYKLYVVMNSNDYVDIGDFHSGYAITKHTNKVCGYIDKNGYETLLYEYDEVGDFCGLIAPVRLEDNWGFINKKMDLIIPLKYVWVKSFNSGFIVKESFNSEYVVLNNEGKEIFRHMDILKAQNKVPNSLETEISNITRKDYVIPFSNRKYSYYVNDKEEKIIPYCNQECRDFSEGFVVVKVAYDDIRVFNEKGKQLKIHTCFEIDASNSFLEKLIERFDFRVTSKVDCGYSKIVGDEYIYSDSIDDLKNKIKMK